MLCQECRKNEATIHIVKNSYGRQVELNLCEACARKKEELHFTFEPQLSLHKLLTSMLNQGLIEGTRPKTEEGQQCAGCGLTLAQFSQVGRLGCSQCFETFAGNIKPLLRRIHAGTRHTGKVPLKIASRVSTIREIDRLKEDLKARVQQEEFEEAAQIRDKIRSLEEEVKEEEMGEEGSAPSKKGEEHEKDCI